MPEFTVSGSFVARDGWQGFETTVSAPNEDVAQERAYAALGSRHGKKRNQIELEEVSQ